jgi:hypothetical protein
MSAMHRRGWIWLGVIGALGMIAAFATIVAYPIPDLPGGWCYGVRSEHYAVQSVTETALYLDLVAAGAVIVAAGAHGPARVGRGRVG